MYSEDYLASIVDKYDRENVSDDDLIELIISIAKSGDIFDIPDYAYDFASTGGPSSLSTLLVPLYIYGNGLNVVNLAVPGRPAGAVDVLAQIPNYDLNTNKLRGERHSNFYIHLAASERFVPLDKQLFEYRKEHNKVNVPNLVIASILSKKLASGAKAIGLDVRMSSFGNFGNSWADSMMLSQKYNRLASILGIKSTCFISNANYPYQKYIGRGESLLALYELFFGQADEWLQSHALYCRKMAETMINDKNNTFGKSSELVECFSKNLETQGSSLKYFKEAVTRIMSEPRQIVSAQSNGFVHYDLRVIRDVIVQQQMKSNSSLQYPDPCGVILLCKPGEYVYEGQSVFSARFQDPSVIGQLQKAFSTNQQAEEPDLRIEVI